MVDDTVHAPLDRSRRMRDAARELWLEHGYRTSMDAVARRAGCSKQTVYAHFGSKAGLFREVVADLISPLIASLDPREGDIGASLLAFSRAHAEKLGAPETVARRRILISEAPRFPDEAAVLWQSGLEAIQAHLATLIANAMQRGDLRVDDPAAAAEVFLGLHMGIESERLFFGRAARPTAAARASWAAQAVNFFLRLYAPATPH